MPKISSSCIHYHAILIPKYQNIESLAVFTSTITVRINTSYTDYATYYISIVPHYRGTVSPYELNIISVINYRFNFYFHEYSHTHSRAGLITLGMDYW